MDRVAGVGETMRRVFDAAAASGVTPLVAAEEIAGERLRARADDPALPV